MRLNTDNDGPCSVDDCAESARARGWCSKHYRRWRHHGHVKLLSELPEEQRFWMRVDVGTLDECWEWTGGTTTAGYGQFSGDDGKELAHRFSWSLANGADPGELQVMHLCENPPCVNPAHLELGTQSENLKYAVRNGRRWGSQHGPGEAHRHSKLTAADVRAIRRRCAQGESQSSVADSFGVNQSTVSRIVRRKRWGHL